MKTGETLSCRTRMWWYLLCWIIDLGKYNKTTATKTGVNIIMYEYK